MISGVWWLTALCLLPPQSSPERQVSIPVRPLSVTEVRHYELPAAGKYAREARSSFRLQPGYGTVLSSSFTITLELKAPECAAATQYGFVELVKAQDDQGRPLRLDEPKGFAVQFPPRTPTDQFVDLDRSKMFSGLQMRADVLLLDLVLEPPPRDARKITLVGQLKLRTAERTEVLVSEVATKVGEVRNPQLEAVGVRLSVLEPAEVAKVISTRPEGTLAVGFELSGDLDRVVEMLPVDARGEKIDRVLSSSSGNLPRIVDGVAHVCRLVYWFSNEPVGQVHLKLALASKLETLVVPFEISELELP